MITVHHLEKAQSFRVVWLLEELKLLNDTSTIDYELKLYKRTEEKRMAPPEYKALSPLGTAPTITTSDGFVMNESNAILEFIVDLATEAGGSGGTAAAALRPRVSSPSRESFLFWFHAVQGSMQPMLTVDIVFRRAVLKVPCIIRSIVAMVGSKVRDALIMPRLNNMLEMAERQLSKEKYLAGNNLTIADISAIYPFSSLFTRYPEYSDAYPACQAWLDRMFLRPAFQTAQKKVGEEGGIVFENE